MSKITVTAKTVEDALIKASVQLSITSDKLQYKVLDKGKAGILGIGSKNAVIEVIQDEYEVEEDNSVDQLSKKSIELDSLEEESQVKENSKDNKETVDIKSQVKDENSIALKETVDVSEGKVKVQKVNSEVQEHTIVVVKKFIEDVLTSMGIEATITTDIEEDGSLLVNMEGKEMGVLIGKRGQTLDSLQYLLNRVANKEQDGYIRVKLDTENYRERRKKTLENLAKNIAYKVKKTRQSVALEPMNPYERRIIHAALQHDSKISTHSEGVEPHRKVVVTLAKH